MSGLSCSVIVVARNAEKTIGECLDSLRKQTQPPLEVVVVDNGSTDRTADVALRLGAVVVKEPRAGRARARNAGVRAARGELVAFVDADAVASPEWLKRLIERFRQSGAAGVAGNVYAKNPEKLIPRLLDTVVRDSPHFATWNILYDRSVLEEVGLFDERLGNAEDVELAWRILSRGYKIEFKPEAVVYHLHRESLREFAYQQYDYGRWSTIARRLRGLPTTRTKWLIFLAPLTFVKHALKLTRKHVLLPLLMTLSSISYAIGAAVGLLTPLRRLCG